MNWQDPAVVAAIISAVASVLAALIGALSAAFIGKRWLNVEELKKNEKLAQNDIAFLLFVEESHCKKNVETHGQSFKLRVREAARDAGLSWSGKYTPGRVHAREQLGDNAPRLIKLYQKFRSLTASESTTASEKTDAIS